MTFPKVVVDTYDDAVAVNTNHGLVYLNNNDVPEPSHALGLKVDYAFHPDAARRLAKALKKAAKCAESER